MKDTPHNRVQDEEKQEEMTERMYEDRRTFHRFKVKMPLRYHFLELEIRGKGDLLDIGANGIGMLTNRRLNLFAPIAIKVEIPFNKELFYFTGEVVWVKRTDFNSYRAGIRFNSPSLIGVWKVLNGLRLKEDVAGASSEQAGTAEAPARQGVLKKITGAFNSARLRLATFLF